MNTSSVWNIFVQELQDNILPLYLEREMAGRFDPHQVHGRLHICRSILFSEWMARVYDRHNAKPLDHYAICMAVAFHDSKRQDGGTDYWEKESAAACQDYLARNASLKTRYNETQSGQVAGWILKQLDGTPNHRVVFDADVLEYMRLLDNCAEFRRSHFLFLGLRDPLRRDIQEPDVVREAIIAEAWNWIDLTKHELRRSLFHSHTYMQDVLSFLEAHRHQFPLLAEVLSET